METADKAEFHIVLVKAWIRKGDRYLIARRASTELQAPGLWSLPGGKVDQRVGLDVIGEVLREEVGEEVGVELAPRLQLVYNNAFTRVDGAHVVGLTFLCEWAAGEAKPLDETSEIQWLTLPELSDLDELPSFMRNELLALQAFLREQF